MKMKKEKKTTTQKIRHMLGNIIQEIIIIIIIIIINNRNSIITSREDIKINIVAVAVEEAITETTCSSSSTERRIKITKAKTMCKKMLLNIKQNSSHTQMSKRMMKIRDLRLQNLLMKMVLLFKNLE